MFREQYDDFAQLLDETYSLISAGKVVLPALAKAAFFRAMERYPLDVVRGAFNAHVSDPARGQYLPKPADLIFQIEAAKGHDGRPGAEEAWAMALAARDESETVVWTEEMRDAFALCRSVLDLGDEVGARVAFREAYNRMVEQARRNTRPARWETSLGWDTGKREAAITKAVNAGLLPAPAARAMLPNYSDGTPEQEPCPAGLAMVKAELAKLQAGWKTAADRRAAAAQAEREAIQAQKHDIASQVTAYQQDQSKEGV